MPDQLKPASNGNTTLTAERREARRYPFVCHAELIDVAGSTRISARTTDMSLRGCYIDTLNPFPVGTRVRLQLMKSDEQLEFRAKVTSCHMGSGMGLLFERLTSAQKKTVAFWLEKASSGSETSFSAPPSPGTSSDPAKKNVRFAEKLVKMLEGRGILSPSEAADLLRELDS
jgi:PilZ domain-containing protein